MEFPTLCLVVTLTQLLGHYDMTRQVNFLPNVRYLPLIFNNDKRNLLQYWLDN